MTPITTLKDEAVKAAILTECLRSWLCQHGDFPLPWALAETLAELLAVGERLSREAAAAPDAPADDAAAVTPD